MPDLPNDNITSDQIKQLENGLESNTSMWRDEISTLNSKLKNFDSLTDLMNEVYTKRQIAVEQKLNVAVNISRLNARYEERKSTYYQHYKTNSQIKLTDGAINTIIDGDLRELNYIISIYNNYYRYMEEIVKTIDGIMYGINSRITIEQITRGLNSN